MSDRQGGDPVDVLFAEEFVSLVESSRAFWLSTAELPPTPQS